MTRRPQLTVHPLAAVALSMVLAAAAWAETVELVDGQQVKGKVTDRSGNTVVVQMSPSQSLRLSRDLVQRIWRDDEKPPPPFKGDGRGLPTQIQSYPRMPDPKDAYPTISLEREGQITQRIDGVLKLDTPAARAAALAALPKDDRDLIPPADTIERWLSPQRQYPEAAGKPVLINLPWKGANARAVAYLGVPRGYDPVKQAWPLVIAMHGTEDQPNAITSKFRGVVGNGCLLLAPRTTDAREFWTSPTQWANIRAAIGHLADHYRIDPRRIVICGGSGGGMGTWGLAMRFPELFCAAGSFSGMPGVSPSMVDRLRHMPFYVLHGRSDHIPIAGPREMVAAMRKLGIEPVYVEYDGDHYPPVAETNKMEQWLGKAPPKEDVSPRPALLQFTGEATRFKLPPVPASPATRPAATRPAASQPAAGKGPSAGSLVPAR